MCTQKAVLSKPLWRCWSTAVISSIFHIPHLIHLRMPLKEDKGVSGNKSAATTSEFEPAASHLAPGCEYVLSHAQCGACGTCEWTNFTTFEKFRRCDLECFFFFFFRVLCERKEKKKKRNHSSSSNALCGLELYMQKCECFALSTCPDILFQIHHCTVTHLATKISSHYLPLFTPRPDDSSRPKTLREWE